MHISRDTITKTGYLKLITLLIRSKTKTMMAYFVKFKRKDP